MQLLKLERIGGGRQLATELAREKEIATLQVDQERRQLRVGQPRAQPAVAILQLGDHPLNALASPTRAFLADHGTECCRSQAPSDDYDRRVSISWG